MFSFEFVIYSNNLFNSWANPKTPPAYKLAGSINKFIANKKIAK